MYGWLYNENLEAKKYYYSQQGGFDSKEGWSQYLDDLARNLEKIKEAATDSSKKVSDIHNIILTMSVLRGEMEDYIGDKEFTTDDIMHLRERKIRFVRM